MTEPPSLPPFPFDFREGQEVGEDEKTTRPGGTPLERVLTPDIGIDDYCLDGKLGHVFGPDELCCDCFLPRQRKARVPVLPPESPGEDLDPAGGSR